jgi:hypothetical protein
MRTPVLAGAILLGLILGGCSIPLADMPLVGLPANTPARPATPAEYLPVHDLPPPRDEQVLNATQQQKLEKDLIAARDRQASGAQAAERRNN